MNIIYAPNAKKIVDYALLILIALSVSMGIIWIPQHRLTSRFPAIVNNVTVMPNAFVRINIINVIVSLVKIIENASRVIIIIIRDSACNVGRKPE